MDSNRRKKSEQNSMNKLESQRKLPSQRINKTKTPCSVEFARVAGNELATLEKNVRQN
jgi:hypothetical protein